MDTKRPFTGVELLLIACAPHTYDNFKIITKKKVVDICVDKGYITSLDIQRKSKRYQFIVNVFERDYPAMILSTPTTTVVKKPDDYHRVQEDSLELAKAIIEDIGKSLMEKKVDLPF
ncbi:hypothetical protein QTO16_10760 [Vibrio harveyi]|uniref:hypothetical protein n=1 Tax=Vibrio harveyi TaxID=669 RepID=UPI00215BEDA8|nr:hypothetical protein [Vibrio harveyi]MCR9772574.1 hypothetical protein [Vibrio harveyi]